MQRVEDSTWRLFEMFIWNNEFSSFTLKHQVLVLFVFAKVQKGSKQLWEFFENTISRQTELKVQDINFTAW
jgi:hypothetical protein